MRESEDVTYLGDGCYVERDADGCVVLTTSDGINTTNRIVLDPGVYVALIRWAGKQGDL